jgi:hypothetical protein
MLNGDLSNRTAARVLLVFEGLIGYLPAEKVPEYEKYAAEERWDEVIYQFDINSAVVNKILYLTWNANYNFHVVTWFPTLAATAIQEKLDELSVPVRSVFSSTPGKLAKMLVNNPDIVAVYDTVPQHVLTFGSKAQLVTDVNQIGT